ncbi:MAG: hypothetical protein MUO31_03990 [Thermodesulfovibrionales bacterium]|nr:hypothetical protein [Thermodesulfovibrionales bacterium]
MKKISSVFTSKLFWGCRFNYDDIENILNLFEEKKYSIEIRNNEYEYEDLNDLKKNLGETPRNFTIKASVDGHSFQTISIIFKMRTTYIGLQCIGENDALILLYGKLLELCKSHHINYLGQKVLFLFAIVVILFAYSKKRNDLISWLAVGLSILTAIFYSYFSFRKSVVLKRKNEGGFWKKSKDTVLVAAITALITAIITAIITHILTKTFQ